MISHDRTTRWEQSPWDRLADLRECHENPYRPRTWNMDISPYMECYMVLSATQFQYSLLVQAWSSLSNSPTLDTMGWTAPIPELRPAFLDQRAVLGVVGCLPEKCQEIPESVFRSWIRRRIDGAFLYTSYMLACKCCVYVRQVTVLLTCRARFTLVAHKTYNKSRIL